MACECNAFFAAPRQRGPCSRYLQRCSYYNAMSLSYDYRDHSHDSLATLGRATHLGFSPLDLGNTPSSPCFHRNRREKSAHSESWYGLSSSEQPIGGTKPWHNPRFAVTSRSWRELNNPGKQVAAPGSCRQSPTFPEHPDGEASAVTNSYYHFTASLPFGASPQMGF